MERIDLDAGLNPSFENRPWVANVKKKKKKNESQPFEILSWREKREARERVCVCVCITVQKFFLFCCELNFYGGVLFFFFNYLEIYSMDFYILPYITSKIPNYNVIINIYLLLVCTRVLLNKLADAAMVRSYVNEFLLWRSVFFF